VTSGKPAFAMIDAAGMRRRSRLLDRLVTREFPRAQPPSDGLQ